MLVAWAPPELSETEWYSRFRGEFPYPRTGEYHPIDAMVLPPGVVPDEGLNQFCIKKLPQELGLAYEAKLRMVQEKVDRIRTEEKRQLQDAVDDAMPAYGSLPKDMLSPETRATVERSKHVSFPTKEKEVTLCH
jgi:hypothetical protein